MRILILLATLLLPLTAHADADLDRLSYHGMRVLNPWTTAASKAMVRARPVYMTIENHTNGDDTLIKATTPVAERVELQVMRKGPAGVMNMFPVEAFILPKGYSAVLTPGGDHLMLYNLTQDLVPGMEFPLELHFKNATRRVVRVRIGGPNDTAYPAAAGGMDW